MTTKKDLKKKSKDIDAWKKDIDYDFGENYEVIDWKNLKKGMLIKYYSKRYEYNGKVNEEQWKGGGFITYIEPDFIGIKSTYGGTQWTIQRENVLKIVRNKKVGKFETY